MEHRPTLSNVQLPSPESETSCSTASSPVNEDDSSERPDTIQLQLAPDYGTCEYELGGEENLELQNSLCENNVVASTPVSKGNTSSAPKSKKGKPWASNEKKATSEEIDRVILQTASSLSEQLRNGKRKFENGDDNDEDSLFCRSLIPPMKRLLRSSKYSVRLQIE